MLPWKDFLPFQDSYSQIVQRFHFCLLIIGKNTGIDQGRDWVGSLLISITWSNVHYAF